MNDNCIVNALNKYINRQNNVHYTHDTTEYTYREPLTDLLNSLTKNNIYFFEEAKHIRTHKAKVNNKKEKKNAPDYSIKFRDSNGNITNINLGYLETKNPNNSLNNKIFQNQFNRYKRAFRNVIFTDYLHFNIWENNHWIATDLRICKYNFNTRKFEKTNNAVKNLKKLIRYINLMRIPHITKSSTLSNRLAEQAKFLSDSTREALDSDIINNKSTRLREFYNQFRKQLMGKISSKVFSDYVAQTITYGMFVSRIYDKDDKNFNIDKASEHIPNTDPFLHGLFTSMTDEGGDYRLRLNSKVIAATFNNTDVTQMFSHIDNINIILTFYEKFLSRYNPKLKKNMGVWYTKKEICKFIVKSIDFLLSHVLNIKNGLASQEYVNTKHWGNIPKVQILDPATGTGTFLVEIVHQIFSHFKGDKGSWKMYAEGPLTRQIHAFEILMVPYTIAHLQVYSAIKDTSNNINLSKDRLRIYLTNALTKDNNISEDSNNYLEREKRRSYEVKNELPIMVILGNPPYNGKKSQNKFYDISSYENNLNVKSAKAVNDDYVKFIHLAEEYIKRNNMGIVGYITSSTYLDADACRVMRNHLSKTFDDIYIIDLHGGLTGAGHLFKRNKRNGKKVFDENIFNIRSSVAITFFVKKGKKSNNPAYIHYTDIIGTKKYKLSILNKKDIFNFIKAHKFVTWKYKINSIWGFKPGPYIINDHYNEFWPISNIFDINDNGIMTGNDRFTIKDTKVSISKLNRLFKYYNLSQLKQIFEKKQYNLTFSDVNHHKWNLTDAYMDIKKHNHRIINIEYRPLEYRYTIMTEPNSSSKDKNSCGFLLRPRMKASKLMFPYNYFKSSLVQLNDKPLAIVLPKRIISQNIYNHALVTNCPIDNRILSLRRGEGVLFPIRRVKHLIKSNDIEYYSNYSNEFLKDISKTLGEKYVHPDKMHRIKLLEWIISLLWAPQYVNKYSPKLKRLIARIPLPDSRKHFSQITKIGKKLIKAFTLDNTNKYQNIKIPVEGSNYISSSMRYCRFDKRNSRLFFNKIQYFTNISYKQYSFLLGDFPVIYQWLKSHRGEKFNSQLENKFKNIIGAINLILKCRKDLNMCDFLNNY